MTERLTMQSIIGEAFVKCAQVVLSSRIYSGARLVSDKRASRWFLLELEEVESAARELDAWRKDVYAPLVMEVYIQPHGSKSVVTNRDGTEHATGAGEMLLERWVLQYSSSGGHEAAKGGVSSSSSGSSRTYVDEAAVYKRLTILIRSLYSYVRVLPAYRMYRTGKRQPVDLFTMGYRITRALPLRAGGGGSKLQQFSFAPVETQGGFFKVAVDFQPAATIHILEQTTAPVSVPRIISDYIGSPALPSTSAPTQRYGVRPVEAALQVAGRRPPMSASVCDSRVDRHLRGDPGANSPPRDSHSGGGTMPVDPHAPRMAVVRQSWSSVQMHVTLPTAPPSPGGVLMRRSSSGLGAASAGGSPPTPASPHPSPGRAGWLPTTWAVHHPGEATGRPPLPHTGSLPRSLSSAGPRTPHAAGTSPAQHPHARSPPAPSWLTAGLPSAGLAHALAAAATTGPPSADAEGAAAAAGRVPPLPDGPHLPGTGGALVGNVSSSSAFNSREAADGLNTAGLTSEGAAAAAGAPLLPFGRQISAPVCIPPKSSRTRSVADLRAQYGFPVDLPPAHALQGTASGGDDLGAFGEGGGAPGRRLAPTGASAPAAPRGMLGQAFGALLTKDAARPLAERAAAAAAGIAAAAAAGSASGSGGGVGAAAAAAAAGPTPVAAPSPTGPRITGMRTAPHMPYPCSYDGSGSSVSSVHPLSCSPQLPFAVTPSGNSLASLAEHHAFVTAPHMAAAFHQVPTSVPVLVARDISALATIRRPSWSSRSSSWDVAGTGGGGAAAGLQHLGASPLADLLESSLWATGGGMSLGTAPYALHRMPTPASSLPMAIGRQHLPGVYAAAGKSGRAADGPPAQDLEPPPGLCVEESESDLLPFALDSDFPSALGAADHSLSQQRGPGGGGGGGGGTSSTALVLVGPESDVAVGAFIRMLQDAPPLSLAAGAGGEEGTAAEALAELSGLAQRLKSFLSSENH